ncbi:nischarin related [Holotrichia oblita]|uniref:Nischarin related n=1 Tax=Holotrichia oblita TaxID=644536 RepID=A0ACB9SYR7_HOLOL|nr:nischarin related [Holotrichia oblita]
MDRDVTKLAELLRQNGDKISNGSCKFTLTSDLLNHLNSSFNVILERREVLTSSFHVLSNTNENNEKYRDLYFLYDFVQLSKSLKLTRNQNVTQQEYTDVSKFKDLCFLEIHKVDVNTIFGIGSMRMKLQYLICERCINQLSDLLESCGADKTEGHTWCELKEAIFTHNNLKEIDNSLQYVPWLNTLDLSNNLIEDGSPLSSLMNLKYLNLSFNKLTKVPLFSGYICRRLQVLVIHNNFIDNIEDIYKLVNLQDLNLMDNYLVDHDSLIPLAYLAALQSLNLQGNPLSYHPQHRIRSVRCLHKNTATVKFILDDIGLSKSEQQSINSLHPKILSVEPSSSSNNSESNDVFDRSIRIRQAVIADDILECLESSLPTVVSHASPVEHDNKEQMASLHKDYIRILYDKAGVSTKDVTKEGNSESFVETHQQLLSSTPLGESILNTIQDTLKEDNDLSNNTTGEYITASDNANNEEQQDVYTDTATEENQDAETTEESEDEELESGESNIFMANLKGGNDIIVILTQTHITEKDPINMKSLGRFTLDSLYICNKIIEDDIEYIYLEFDTVRINSSKYYSIEDEEDRNRFYDKLRNIIDSRPPKEISNLFKCMKCSTQFGVEDQKTMHRVVIKCPLCESDLVFQEDGN